MSEPVHPRRRRALGWGEKPLDLGRPVGQPYTVRSNPPSPKANWQQPAESHGPTEAQKYAQYLLRLPKKMRKLYIEEMVKARRDAGHKP